MKVVAMARLAITMRRARRDSAITAGSVARSSRTMTASAVSRARSDPARPIATPVCAAARAGASLTPPPPAGMRRPQPPARGPGGEGPGGGVVGALSDEQHAPAGILELVDGGARRRAGREGGLPGAPADGRG